MVKNQVLTIEGVIAHAAIMELGEVDFLDTQGRPGARASEVKFVRLIFIDGKQCTMSHKEFKDNLSGITFTLRPQLNDS